jgi:hypothetical protein
MKYTGEELEKLFISALGSNEILRWYLKYEINLVDYLDKEKKGTMMILDLVTVLIPRETKLEMIGDVSAERILKILQKERPDLYNTLIKHPRGVAWINNQTELFKKRFL